MYVIMCIYVYVCMYDVRHDIQIPCTRYVAINRLYLYLYINYSGLCMSTHTYSFVNAMKIAVMKCIHWRTAMAGTEF